MSTALRLAQLVEREAPRAADFAALTEVCEGAWPGDVCRALLENSREEARRLLVGIDRSSCRVSSDHRLPLAHPLDADWRFTRDCAWRILNLVLGAASRADDVLLIAMPSVALAAYDCGLADRIVVASRVGDPIDIALRAAMPGCRFIDLREIPTRAFQTVALDPPWYDDVALPLIGAARDAVAPDGHVFICAPDHLTSPSSAQRLSALASSPQALGFSSAECVERVRYATPFFELRCLEALGIANVSPRWRTGLLYTCTPAHRALRVWQAPHTFVDVWREVRRGAVRVWVRELGSREGGAVVAVARSISRTDRARALAGVWTSGNTYVANSGAVPPEMFESTTDDPGYPSWRGLFHDAMLDELAAMGRAVDYF